jgi:DNA-binding transcriptional ArsR family regulator
MPQQTTRQRSIEITDPRALRALAHPTRLELIGLLRRSGPLTATQAGEQIGASAASCSFHLRQLAKYGLVEEAGGGRGRERPWQATANFTEWPLRDSLGGHHEVGALLSRVVIERYFQAALAWLDREPSEPPAWAEAATDGDAILYLTAEELVALNEQVTALLEPFLERLEDPATRPPDARPVEFIRLAFPIAGAGERD